MVILAASVRLLKETEGAYAAPLWECGAVVEYYSSENSGAELLLHRQINLMLPVKQPNTVSKPAVDRASNFCIRAIYTYMST